MDDGLLETVPNRSVVVQPSQDGTIAIGYSPNLPNPLLARGIVNSAIVDGRTFGKTVYALWKAGIRLCLLDVGEVAATRALHRLSGSGRDDGQVEG